jgi:menaquinol-cytochrome c reductase iron-sulfur subunit
MQRRSLLQALGAAGSAVLAAIVGIPSLLAAISPALRRREERWQPVGFVDDFPEGETVEAKVEIPRDDTAHSLRQRLLYVRREQSETIVFSRNCTDLSCPVAWHAGSQCFFCPCHGGIFTRDGTPIHGPPPQPLFRYANRERGGRLEVDLNSVPPMV